MKRVVTRRRLLGALATALPLAVLSPGLARVLGSRDREMANELRRALRDLLPNRRSAAAIGSAYLARFPHESDARELSHSLLNELGHKTQQGDVRDLSSRLRAQIRQDFAREHTVWLKGWCLSRTEARLCVLRGLA